MELDLSSLKKAIAAFERALVVTLSEEIVSSDDYDLKEALRAGIIQNFEFTYELCWKFIRRWLKINVKNNIDGITRKELFRLAAENQLINNFEEWLDYHEARNETSHTYDEIIAEDVFEIAQEFLVAAKALLTTLEQKNA